METALDKRKISEDHFKLAQNCEGLQKFDEAIKEYRTSLETEFNQGTLLRLIQLLRYTGKSDLVEEVALNNLKFIAQDDLFFRNVLLNELEMAQKKIILSTKIRSFTITLTNKCNLACLACEARKYEWQMRQETIKEIIANLPYLEYIMWQGGEVFLLDYFADILEESRRYPHIKQLIVTNAMLIEEDLIEKLIMLPDIVLAISVDGTTKDVYENIRRGAKFDQLIATINLINLMRKRNNSNLRLHLNVTIMKSNYHQLLDFIEFARKFGFYSLLLRPVQGNINSPENIFKNQDKEALSSIDNIMDELNSRVKQYDLILDNRLPNKHKAMRDTTCGKPDRSVSGNGGLICYAPWQRLYISWGGNVYPDCMCSWPKDQGIGNVTKDSIKEIWNNQGMQAYRRKIIENDYQDICTQDCVAGNVPASYLIYNK